MLCKIANLPSRLRRLSMLALILAIFMAALSIPFPAPRRPTDACERYVVVVYATFTTFQTCREGAYMAACSFAYRPTRERHQQAWDPMCSYHALRCVCCWVRV
jgi:hypothetical protein